MSPATEAGALARREVNDVAAKSRDGIQVIARAADVLRHLASDPDGLTMVELAARAELPRSTTHRIMRALSQEGFTRADPAGRYTIGPSLIGIAARGRRELRDDVAPHLQRLSSQLGETVDLAVLSGANVLFVDQYASTQALRVVSEVGARFPAHCTANGKALLAALPPRQVEGLLPQRLKRLTRLTITSRDVLVHELDEVRLSRVAYDLEEHSIGICAVGTTIRDCGGETAAVTVVVPAARFAERGSIVTALLHSRREIQVALGCPD